ncbi:adenylosuccinate synthetase [Oceanivirga miroungae]|uniref:Adenylosuccinate synthetase n=1 Tax=Oceanivirga miroungae TaxID=1130046 RepID=A0A6I8MEP1_9FUSO|nr:adenylosuccinate synthetase [Oceanivirga miroungae]VWL85564.1 adenylosuccinate synthetase [Oceanivirga miroungae]
MEKKFNTSVVVGLQFGEEGKTRILKELSNDSDYIVIANCDNIKNTVKINDVEISLSVLPVEVINKNLNIIFAASTFIDINLLLEDIRVLEKHNLEIAKIWIDYRANIIMSYHILIEKSRQKLFGKNNIKNVMTGLSYAYLDKIQKNAIRFCDLLNMENFSLKLRNTLKEKNTILSKLGENEIEFEYIIEKYKEYANILKFNITDTMIDINNRILEGKKILFKTNTSTMLDINYGTYPDVNITNATISGICYNVGVSTNKIENKIGVLKAYTTRKDEGFLPTEVFYDIKEHLISKGEDNKSSLRCAWLDLGILKYSLLLNGVNKLYLTKLDVLSGLDKIKLGVAYEIDKIVYQTFPLNVSNLNEFSVLYKEFDGWQEDISNIKEYEKLPKNCKRYVEYIEGYLGIKFDKIAVAENENSYIDR